MSEEHDDRGMRELDELLSAAPLVEPPPELTERILSAIRLPAQGQRRRPTPWWHALKSPAVPRYAFAAAAGALVVAMAYEMHSPLLDVPDLSQVVGTLSPGAGVDSDTVLDTVVLDTGNIYSVARLAHREGELVLDILIDADRVLEVDVDLGGQELAFEALMQAPGSRPSIRMTGSRMTIDGQGRHAVVTLLRGDAGVVRTAEIRILFTSNGTTLKKDVLRTDRQSRPAAPQPTLGDEE